MKKLSLKESVEGGETALRGSVSAPKGFSKGKPLAAKLRGRSPRVQHSLMSRHLIPGTKEDLFKKKKLISQE